MSVGVSSAGGSVLVGTASATSSTTDTGTGTASLSMAWALSSDTAGAGPAATGIETAPTSRMVGGRVMTAIPASRSPQGTAGDFERTTLNQVLNDLMGEIRPPLSRCIACTKEKLRQTTVGLDKANVIAIARRAYESLNSGTQGYQMPTDEEWDKAYADSAAALATGGCCVVM